MSVYEKWIQLDELLRDRSDWRFKEETDEAPPMWVRPACGAMLTVAESGFEVRVSGSDEVAIFSNLGDLQAVIDTLHEPDPKGR